MEVVSGGATNSKIVERFVNNLPHRPYCMADKDEYQQIRSLETALQSPYIQHNSPAFRHVLVFDIDEGFDFDREGRPRKGSTYAWERADLPPPNFICRNPKKGNCHYYYVLAAPICRTMNARNHPQDYVAAIERAYRRKLPADIGYADHQCKNPLHNMWETLVFHEQSYSLGELADYVDLSKTHRYASRVEVSDEGRNCNVFDELRQWAYSEVNAAKTQCSYDQWMKEVLYQAKQLNAFRHPLSYNELAGIARSVGKWTWYNYTGNHTPKRTLKLDPSLPLETRQRLAAKHTAEVKSNQTKAKVVAAIALLKAQGKRISKAAVARVIGISRQQVTTKYASFFQEALSQNTVNLAHTSDNSTLGVNHDEVPPLGEHLSGEKVKSGVAMPRHPFRAPLGACRTLKDLLAASLRLSHDSSLAEVWGRLPRKRRASTAVQRILEAWCRVYSDGGSLPVSLEVQNNQVCFNRIGHDDGVLLERSGFKPVGASWCKAVRGSTFSTAQKAMNLVGSSGARGDLTAIVNHVAKQRVEHVELNVDLYMKGLSQERRSTLQGVWGDVQVLLDSNLYEYTVKFKYAEHLVYRINQIGDRTYDRTVKAWRVPVWMYDQLLDFLHFTKDYRVYIDS